MLVPDHSVTDERDRMSRTAVSCRMRERTTLNRPDLIRPLDQTQPDAIGQSDSAEQVGLLCLVVLGADRSSVARVGEARERPRDLIGGHTRRTGRGWRRS